MTFFVSLPPHVNVVWKMLVDRVDRRDLARFVCYCNMGKGKWDCKGKMSILGQLNHSVSACSKGGGEWKTKILNLDHPLHVTTPHFLIACNFNKLVTLYRM